MNLSNLTIGLLAAAGLTMSGAALAQPMTKDARDQAYKAAEAQYKTERDACNAHSGNAKDVCVEEAKGREKVAKAEADASYQNTPKARESARQARADAAYEVAKEKCDDLAGNPKDVCTKEAKAAHTKGLADAKMNDKVGEARRDASKDKMEANYEVAAAKCDVMSGDAKDRCIAAAKAKYGKS